MTMMIEQRVVPPELEFLAARVSSEQFKEVVDIALTQGLWTAAAEVYELGEQLKKKGEATLREAASAEAKAEADRQVKHGSYMMRVARDYRVLHPVNNFVRGCSRY